RNRKVLGNIDMMNENAEGSINNSLLLKAPAESTETTWEEAEAAGGHLINEVGDDRDIIQPGDTVILIVENDLGFARFVLDSVREKGFKGLVTSLGAVALALTYDYSPDAIFLDMKLTDMQGWRVLERLKNDLSTRHIPVCVISTDDARDRALGSSAVAFIAKPLENASILNNLLDMTAKFVHRRQKNILLIEPNPQLRKQIVDAVTADDVTIKAVKDAKAALASIKKQKADCIILNPEAIHLLEELSADSDSEGVEGFRMPIIVYGNGTFESNELRRFNATYKIGHAHSVERVLDLSMEYMHRNISKLPESKKVRMADLHQSNKILAGKKVLIVDDDMRNIFALSSVLEEYQMNIISADNGRDAINMLLTEQDIDIVLMDIMMPEMDGMETMREIRKVHNLNELPIVAVTAKAMKGDREKCIEAGAWDYLSKPVDTEQMINVLCAWLQR
ncbi:MAG: rpfC 2, partial [Alphaproteobacteria bacterium]|nr:rpfC 2 [Alphaproteobacteria bacterium]